MMTMRCRFPIALDGRRHNPLNDVFSRMLCDEGWDFSDVFSEAGEVFHRQVEYQIRFHFLA